MNKMSSKECEEMKRRVGKFKLFRTHIEYNNSDDLHLTFDIFKDMIIVDCHFDYGYNANVYTAIGPMFSILPIEKEVPMYIWKRNNKGEVIFDTKL